MRESYRRRPEDFKRKILKSGVYDRCELLEEENKWLAMIKDGELGKRYYNLKNHLFNHWSVNNLKTVGQKISAVPNRRENISKALRGNPLLSKSSESQREKYRNGNKKQFSDSVNREVVRQQMIAQWQDPEYRARMVKKHSGKQQSQETIEKRKATMLRKRNASF